MRRRYALWMVLFLLTVCWMMPTGIVNADGDKQLIFDDANLLSSEERNELNAMANKYGAERETDFMILTVDRVENVSVKQWTEDFYDEYAPGYDKPHGNTAILTIVMDSNDVHIPPSRLFLI